MTSPAVIRADGSDLDVLSQVITDAFFDLAPSRWLIACPGARRRVFPGYFRLSAVGIVHTNVGRTATALWLPGGPDAAALPDGYAERLAAETDPWTSRFLACDRTLDQHHPIGMPHHHLAILAVHPDQQRRGIGTALLDDYHATLEDEGLPAYLEASSRGARDFYLSHGYALRDGSPFYLPDDGPPLWPMWREPKVGFSGRRTGKQM